MTYSRVYLYSPLSKDNVQEGNNRGLLLQFLLSEMLQCLEADKQKDSLEYLFSSPTNFFPYDLSYQAGCLNKMQEHSQLLLDAFPDQKEAALCFQEELAKFLEKMILCKQKKEPPTQNELNKKMEKFFELLTPLLNACKACENLVLFLVKNRDNLSKLAGNSPLYDENALAEMKSKYQNRGFEISV